MSRLAVDTNVLAIANRIHGQASEECIYRCSLRLFEISKNHIVLVDKGHQIFDEYRRYASARGAPGPGDKFFKWLWDNRANEKRCIEVGLTPRPSDPEDFEEFPDALRQLGFDRNDRKFIAVAVTGSRTPVVVIGIDRGYARYFAELLAEGVDVEFLCPDLCGPGQAA